MKEFQYETPREITDITSCAFYHFMDLPGIGEVGDHWDLRKTIDDYFGHFGFSGKRALDVGSASGFLTFEMEKRGASVVSFDIVSGGDWNVVPFVHPDFNPQDLVKELETHIGKIKNAYWYAHRILKSKAKVYYGDIYNIPHQLGQFDVVMFGMVLPHLRDPFLALQSASRLSKEWIIITQQSMNKPDPLMLFMPDCKTRSDPITWWLMSEGCISRMLGVLGFKIDSISRAHHYCYVRKRSEECTTYIAQRIRNSR